jgi:glycine/D-amino acid oxidase-like deaminating enzyme
MRIIIVGGGAIGSAIAYWLTRERRADVEVVVVERDPSYRTASSARSASSIRQQFSTPINIAIGRFGFDFIRRLGEHLEVDDDAPEVGLVQRGYLFLASSAGVDVLRRNHAVQQACGADAWLLDPDALVTRLPWLSMEGVAMASLGCSGEGWFDGYGLLWAFRRKAAAQGASYLATEAVAVDVEADRVRAIRLADGSVLPCDVFVNAAGPWAAKVGRMMGVHLPVHARRRSVFVIDCPSPLPGCPLVIDTSGFWLRPEGSYLICGMSPCEGEPDPDDLPLEPDHGLFEDRLWPALAHRIPALERLKLVSAWAGYYEVNSFDANGIVGPHPVITNAYFANGFSGHGIQQAPAVGRGIAEHVLEGRYSSLDLSPLGFERIVDGRPLREQNVI